jgi:hypothetical protein
MKSSPPGFFRRSILLVAVGIVAVVLTACTGVGGGYLPPESPVFTGPASFGFTFSCEDKGGINPPTGKLAIQLAYTDHGTNPLGAPFSIHGIVDKVDPQLESALCIGQNPPPPPAGQLNLPGPLPADDIAATGLPQELPGA